MVKMAKNKVRQASDKEAGSAKVGGSERASSKSSKVRKPEAARKRKVAGKTESPSAGWWAQARQYLREVLYELRKVVWPSRKETVASTSVVLVVVILVGIFLGFADLLFSRAMRWIIG